MLRGNELADLLKKSRMSAGLSQKEIAAALGYKSSQFVSNWERGLSSPPIATLRVLCTLFKISENEMFRMIKEIAVQQTERELQEEFFGKKK